MKNLFTILIAICAFTLTCSAQWKPNSTRPYVYLDSGYTSVGIGINPPASRLHVWESDAGNGSGAGITIEQAGSGNSLLQFLQTGTQRWTMGIDNSTTARSFKIATGQGLGIADKFTILTSGNVGIGTTSPGNTLQIGSTPLAAAFYNGAGTVSTAQVVNYTTAGSAIIGTAVVDGTNNFRTSMFADNTNQLVGIALTGSSFNPSFVIRNTSSEYLRITSSGAVGIGTTSPGKQLDVNGDARIRGDQATLYFYRTTSPTDIAYIKHDNTAGTFTVAANTRTFNINNGASFATNLTVLSGGNVGIGTTNPKARLHLNITGTSTDALQIGWDGTIDKGRWSINPFILGVANDGLAITDLTGGGSNVRMVISNAGNVGIGTTNPDQKLTVAGQVHSTEVVVTSTVPADYVFNADYDLRPLADVKAFVDKNHHLPEVPSAADFKKDGQNLGEMNMTLLKKVEELTLYMIEQNKKTAELAEKVKAQQEEIERLKTANK